MTGVFADTSFFLAFLNRFDVHHARAVRLATQWAGRTTTTDCVLWEVGNHLSRGGLRKGFRPFLHHLEKDKATRIVRAGRGWMNDGVRLYSTVLDKDWSLTDCISFVVMRRLRIVEALTADHHFVQAGFRVLLA